MSYNHTPRTPIRQALRDYLQEVIAYKAAKCLSSQAEIAVDGIEEILDLTLVYGPANIPPHDVNRAAIADAIALWEKRGVSPATISKRLSCLSKMGFNVKGLMPKPKRALKWHLSNDDRVRVLNWLDDFPDFDARDMQAYILWATHTGLRVEESLSLRLTDFSAGFSSVNIRGTKTVGSQAVLPLGEEAIKVAEHAFAYRAADHDAKLFLLSYKELRDFWEKVRVAFGWQDDETCTLKALRRSAARYLHADCGMPLDMVRQYLRHTNIETTMEYLRLTGGYRLEEMQRYLVGKQS